MEKNQRRNLGKRNPFERLKKKVHESNKESRREQYFKVEEVNSAKYFPENN